MTTPTMHEFPKPRNLLLHLIGSAILILNKIKHSFEGYKTPRTFPITEIERAIHYDTEVVNAWHAGLSSYIGDNVSLKGRNILELGPGADLGVGLILLSRGAKKYNALDIHNLVENVPDDFYSTLFSTLEKNGVSAEEIGGLKYQLEQTKAGSNDRLNYKCRKDFDLSTFAENEIDTVFSQAAFEHFDDIPRTFFQLGKVVSSGARLVAEVDLNTHTRWIRDADPLHIYRYSDWFYNACKFPGSPNRLNASDYKKALEDSGWCDVKIIPLTKVDDEYFQRTFPHLAKKFASKGDELGLLSILLCATKT